jgi:hypothetical protein
VRGTIALLILSACGSFLPEPTEPADPATANDGGAADGSADIDAGDTVDASGTSDGAAAVDACAGCERVVFATSKQWYPDELGGVAGAQQKCNEVALDPSAHARVKGRKFRPWLSVNGSSPQTTMVHGTGAYVLPTGTKIANDWTDLTDQTIAGAINVTESGGAVDGFGLVWTGTDPIGNATGVDCSGWKTRDAEGTMGKAFDTDLGWTQQSNPDSCNEDHRLYCFEE